MLSTLGRIQLPSLHSHSIQPQEDNNPTLTPPFPIPFLCTQPSAFFLTSYPGPKYSYFSHEIDKYC